MRSWTLQELLVPKAAWFFDRDLAYFGSKDSLAATISIATGISLLYLSNLKSASAALKMSWVTKRQTSRLADVAYCLLGLFDISMPMLYGEGEKAFRPLQLEIIRTTDDESIFAWFDENRKLPHGILAPWPTPFAESGDIVRTSSRTVERPPYVMTNNGLEIRLRLLPTDNKCVRHPHQTLVFGLNCERASATGELSKTLAIELNKHETRNYWQRIDCNFPLLEKDVVETIFRDGANLWLADSLAMTSIYVGQENCCIPYGKYIGLE